MVNGSEKPSGNGNDGLLLTAPLLEGLLLPVDFGMLFAAAGSKRNLNQQRLEISTGFANTSGFLLACALCILRGKASPRAKMLGSIKHRHVCADFSKDADSGKGIMDTGNSQQQFDLREIVLSNLQDKGFQLCFAFFQRIHVAADNFEFLSLFVDKDTVNCFLDLRNRRFAASMHKGSHIKRLSGMIQQLCCDGGCALAEHITEHVIKLEVGNGKAVLGTVLDRKSVV